MMTSPASLEEHADAIILDGKDAVIRPHVRRRYMIGAGVVVLVGVWGLLYSMMTPPNEKLLANAKTTLARVQAQQEARTRTTQKTPEMPVLPKVAAMPKVVTLTPPKIPSVAVAQEEPTDRDLTALSQSSVAVAKQFLDRLQAHEQETQRLRNQIREIERQRDDVYAQHRTMLDYMQHMTQLRQHVRAGTLDHVDSTRLLEDAQLPEDVKEPLRFFAETKDEPIPSEVALRGAYDAALEQYYHALAHSEPSEDDPWYHGVMQRMRAWVVIRKVGAQHKGTDDAAIIARAEAWMQEGDVPHALEEVQRLTVHAAPYFAQWRAQAHRYDAAYRLLDSMEHAMMNHMRHALPKPPEASTP
ncbi:MAG: hypothetical protein EAZ74_01590 [Alphaproteobacteria bacterium]|nr:MAG: hypothetical protein EAZ74_01590 [Alphaproteobacteria bacterium]